jgi:hypothetical protein
MAIIHKYSSNLEHVLTIIKYITKSHTVDTKWWNVFLKCEQKYSNIIFIPNNRVMTMMASRWGVWHGWDLSFNIVWGDHQGWPQRTLDLTSVEPTAHSMEASTLTLDQCFPNPFIHGTLWAKKILMELYNTTKSCTDKRIQNIQRQWDWILHPTKCNAFYKNTVLLFSFFNIMN